MFVFLNNRKADEFLLSHEQLLKTLDEKDVELGHQEHIIKVS